MAQYIFGGNTGETPQSVARKRAIAEAIMGRSLSPQNVGEGFGAIADGIVANVTNQRADAAEQAGTASAQDAFTKALMGDPSALASIGSGGAPGGNFSPASFSGDQQEFVNALLPSALEASKRTGIDPRIIIAQSAQETGWGRHAPGNNFFGIKSHGMPGGNTLATDEEVNGKRIRTQDNFRAYASPEDSVAGYADFILANPRYSTLRNAQGLDAQLQALGESGYATGSEYLPAVSSIARSLNLPDIANTPEQATTAMAARQPFAGGGALASSQLGIPNLPSVTPEQTATALAPNQPFAGGGAISPQQAPQQTARSGPDLNELLMLSANPWLTEGQRGAINTMIETQLKQQDPAYQLGLEKSQLELDALRNPTPKPVYEGGQWWDTSGGVPHALTQPEPGFRQLSAEEAQQRGLDPEKSWQIAPTGEIKQIGGGGVSVNLNGERGYDQTVGKGYGQRFLDIQDSGQAAQRTLNGLDIMEQAMSDPNFYSGSGADYVNGLKRLGASIGLNPDSVSSVETFNALAKQAALDSMGGSLGTGFSNADRDFVTDQVPSLNNTPEGNRKLIAIQRKLNQRKQEIAQQARIYADQHDGRIDAGFDDYLAQWANENPLFPSTASTQQPSQRAAPAANIDYSAPTAPEGWSGDPALWKFMSPEDRALWQ